MPGIGASTMSYKDTLIHMRETEVEILRDNVKNANEIIDRLHQELEDQNALIDEHETTGFRLRDLLERNNIEYKDSLL